MSLLDTASLIVTPNAYAESKLYSVIPSDGSGDMSVVRATTATRVNSAGLVEIVPYNLLTYSEQLDNADWTKFGISVTANATTAPNGTLTADKIISSSSLVNHLIHNTPKVFSQGDYCFSVYVKAAGFNKVAMRESWSVGFYASFDLTNGTIIDSSSSQTNTITAVGNGWYRITSTRNFVGDIVLGLIPLEDSYTGGNPLLPYAGDNVKGIFAWGAQIVFGTSALPYQKTETRLNIPRLDYSNGTCPSLLVEPQRTNLVLQSSSFDNAAWTKEDGNGGSLPIVTANYGISPDGTQNADRIQLTRTTTSGSFSYVWQLFSVSAGQTYTWSVWLKSLSGTPSIVLSYDGASYTNNVTLTNEWKRYEFTTTISGTTLIANFLLWQQLPSTSLTADFLAYGFQLEQGNYATSYIPTTSASVTRNADVISKTGISSLIGQTEGTLFADFDFDGSGFGLTNDFFLYVGDGANTDAIYIDYYNNIFRWVVFNGSTLVFYTDLATTNGRHKLALGYKAGQYVAYADGNLILADTNATAPPTCAMLSLAQNVTGFGSIAKEINAAALWQTRLTNTQLAQLTTI